MSTLKNRLMPPKCENLNDWITMVAVMLTVLTFVLLLISVMFFPAAQNTLFVLLGMAGSFCFGRVSSEIEPKK